MARPYKITRRTARGPSGWHWCIDVTINGRRSNFSCSRPYRSRVHALCQLYFGQGWRRWVLCHVVYDDFSREHIL